MINLLDLVVAALALLYLLKNAGGVLKTAKNILLVLVVLIVFGVLARLLLDLTYATPIHRTLSDSYFVKLSHFLLKGIYPAIEKTAPSVDSFIKNKIISQPTPEVSAPLKKMPKITLPERPQLEWLSI
jgi:hypothetical protein